MNKTVLLIIYVLFISIIGGCTHSNADENYAKLFRDGYSPQGEPGLEPYDINGDTPDIIVRQYFAYRATKDWEGMFSLYPAKIPASKEEFISMSSESGEELIDYFVADFVIQEETRAAVKVGYLLNNQEGQMFFIEWWGCLKEEGVWKIEWLPRQS